jgi:hypothetical protein
VFEAIGKIKEKAILLMPKMATLRDYVTIKRSQINGLREYYDDIAMVLNNTLKGSFLCMIEALVKLSALLCLFLLKISKILKKPNVVVRYNYRFFFNFYTLYKIPGIKFGQHLL